MYRLGYPNREVRQSLNESLLRYLVKDATRQTANQVRLYRLGWRRTTFAGIEELFRAFFASIPHEWYTNNDIARYEGYYASVVYSYFAALGLDVTVEDSSSHGRLDMAVEFNDNVYLFEFKVVELAGEGAAMAQLRSRGYADKYRHLGRPIHLVAVEFSKDDRNVVAFETAHAHSLNSSPILISTHGHRKSPVDRTPKAAFACDSQLDDSSSLKRPARRNPNGR